MTTRAHPGGGPSATYTSWVAMKTRCSNPKDKGFRHYGARGIRVCDRWATFNNFRSDMGEKPPGLTLERVDNDAGYAPGNCVWATKIAQAQNRRCVIWVTLHGRRQCLSDWCKELGVSRQFVTWRVRHSNMTWEQAMTLPKWAGMPNRISQSKS